VDFSFANVTWCNVLGFVSGEEVKPRSSGTGEGRWNHTIISLVPRLSPPPFLRKEHGDEANDGVILMHNKHCALLHGGCYGWVYEKAFGGQHWESHFSPPSITAWAYEMLPSSQIYW